MNRKYLTLGAIMALPFLVASPCYAAVVVDLGTAGDFRILAETGIHNTGTSSIVGDIGVSPYAAASITGFALGWGDPAHTFATSAQVVGKVYASDYADPTPAYVGTAVGDMGTAYTDASLRTADFTPGSASIGGSNFIPGVYYWSAPVTMDTDITISGSATDVWIFQMTGTFNTGSATTVNLSGGALASNIFWQVAGQTTLGTYSHFAGIILDQTGIALQTGATLDGRALAQTLVTLDGNTVIPEPCTVLLLGSGLVGLFASRRRSRSAA